jgi:hypothetical protein
MDDLTELFCAEKLTFPQYQAELAAIRKEIREAESSSSPQREAGQSPGAESSMSPPGDPGFSQSASESPSLPLPKAQERPKVVDKSGDKRLCG